MRRHPSIAARFALIAGCSAGLLRSAWAGAAPGLVVQEVAQGWAGERGGLRVGDVIRSAEIAGGRVLELRSSFDLRVLELEEGGKAAVALRGTRDGTPLRWSVRPGAWDLRTRPLLEGRGLLAWEQAMAALQGKNVEAAMRSWREAVESLPKSRWRERASLWLRAGQVCASPREQLWPQAHRAFDAAREALPAQGASTERGLVWFWQAQAFSLQSEIEPADRAAHEALKAVEAGRPGSLLLAGVLGELGDLLQDQDEAERGYQRALGLTETLAPESMAVASVLHKRAVLAGKRRELDVAERDHRRAHRIRESLAPESLDVASSLNSLGIVAWLRGDLATAEDLIRKGAVLRQRLAPGMAAVAGSWVNLGVISWSRGDLATAEQYYRKALGFYEGQGLESSGLADVLNNLGNVLSERGDWDAAERAFRRALGVEQRIGGSGDSMLHNLGLLAASRRDPATAEDFLRRSLDAKRVHKHDSLDVARSIGQLATVLKESGKLEEAGRMSQGAVDMLRVLTPGGIELAVALTVRADVLEGEGDLARAEALLRESLGIFERQAPGSLSFAKNLVGLGDIAAARGDLDAASSLLAQAVAICSALGPGTEYEAGGLYRLGAVRRRQNRLREAADLFRRAIEAIEAQTERLGGSEEVRSVFAASFRDFYRDYVEVLLELGEPDEAFRGTERYRARSFLAMLAERDLSFGSDLPPDLVREWRGLEASYATVQGELAKSQVGLASPESEPLHVQLRELREKRAEVRRRMREASPRVAALRFPQPLSVREAAEQLDEGTALLSFLVCKSQTLLFVVEPGEARRPLSVFRLPLGEAELQERVKRLRELIQTAGSVAEVSEQSRRLYQSLLAPAEPLLARSRRLLLVADGPLHRLPFSALVRRVRPGDRGASAFRDLRPEYLVETHVLYGILSATVYAELMRSRTGPQEGALAAFGDPAYPQLDREKAEQMALTNLRSAVRTGVTLLPLPFSREEVEAIADLYRGQAAVFLGEEATEEQAKEQAKAARYLHLACHSVLDEQFPINSALVLTVPTSPGEGQEDGLWQAWEIIEKVRLSADLVTLSGCETGLGREQGGEGLVGLTRAFLYAGARSVLASLWAVSDKSTAGLMKRFYGHLKSGKSKAEALRAAQLELIASSRSDASHPFRWASFQLAGDWR